MTVRIKRGDSLPTVAAVQIFLNQQVLIFLNEQVLQTMVLDVDGIFGPKTQQAVRGFQGIANIAPTGTVAQQTWQALIAGTQLRVVDAIDVWDPSLLRHEHRAITGLGGSPITTGGMCGGVQDVVLRIRRQASSGSIVLLRFHGHGGPGVMGVSDGTGSDNVGRTDSSLDAQTVRRLNTVLRTLQTHFASFGSVELHGCHVGAGATGGRLLRDLADLWRVPVSAGRRTQLGGGASTFRFEGPVQTVCPGGRGLKSWARSRPEARMTVAS